MILSHQFFVLLVLVTVNGHPDVFIEDFDDDSPTPVANNTTPEHVTTSPNSTELTTQTQLRAKRQCGYGGCGGYGGGGCGYSGCNGLTCGPNGCGLGAGCTGMPCGFNPSNCAYGVCGGGTMKMSDQRRVTEAEKGRIMSPSDPPTTPSEASNNLFVPPATPAIDIPSTSNRTTSPPGSLPSWIAGASPVKMFTIDELLKLNSTLEKMVLAHEIAVDPNFSIDKLPKDPLEEQVKKVMHDAFWDKLKDDFSKDPPDYTSLYNLMVDLKELMIGLLTEQQVNFRVLIEDGINLPVLKQQFEHGIFDHEFLRFIMDLLGKLCAPARDELLNQLKDEKDVIKQLRGIFEFIELLKVDLANFTVSANRSTIEKYAAEYERDQFMKVLEIDPNGNLGLKSCLKQILEDYLDENAEVFRQKELSGAQVRDLIVNFYMTLLEKPERFQIFPETMKMDESRIKALSEKFLQLVFVISNVFVASNLVGKDICESTGYKFELKKDLMAVMNDVDKTNQMEKIENAAIHCIKKSEAICGPNRFTSELSSTMKHSLLALKDENNSIRKLARDRIYNFIRDMISSGRSNSIRLPPGLSLIQQEIGALTGRYFQLSIHNWRAFGIYYGQLIEQQFKEFHH
uniref:T-complex protein 11-like protein 1 n=1 Tax=Panagrolaimus sp. JU765 TaxID=591449 RepID=A0AC34QNB9_9BILA